MTYQLSYSINADVSMSHDAIRSAFNVWEQIADIDFFETAVDVAVVRVVDLQQGLAAFGVAGDHVGYNLTFTDAAGMPTTSYVMLEELSNTTWTAQGVAAHEIGHVLGLTDRAEDDPNQTLYSYAELDGAHPTRPMADDIAYAQSRWGASPQANEIYAGSGSGKLLGGLGNDTLYGEAGNDIIYGNQGDDRIIDGTGNDVLYGGQGADQLQQISGIDVLYGNLGSDQLWVDDFGVAYGGQNDDTLIGSAHAQLIGGVGNDTYVTDYPTTIIDSDSQFMVIAVADWF